LRLLNGSQAAEHSHTRVFTTFRLASGKAIKMGGNLGESHRVACQFQVR